MADSDFLEEGLRIQQQAGERGLILRFLGAIAFRLHCPRYTDLFEVLNRQITDIDFVALSSQRKQVMELIRELGYIKDDYTVLAEEYGGGRYIFNDTERKRTIDVFLDKLEMCHTIDLRDRLTIEPQTLPLADLLLEKMQIVEVNEKDMKDVIVLLAEHEVGEREHETINIDYISRILAADWGFYFTVTTNLKKMERYLEKSPSILENASSALGRLQKLLQSIESTPKSTKWKMRAMIGTRQKWYNEVVAH